MWLGNAIISSQQYMIKILLTKVWLMLQTRTFWAGVLLFVVAGVQGVQDLLPAEAVTPIMAVLTFLIGYFRINPRVQP